MSFADTVVLFVLALLLFGPKKLPVIARQIGKALNEFKRASNEFKAQIESEISQLEFQERQKKEQEERQKEPQEQKVLPPTAPPPESIPSAFTSEPSLQTPGNGSHQVSPSAASHEIDSATAAKTPNA